MIRTVIVLTFVTTVAHAEQTRVYGRDGRSLGTISRDSAGSERFRDERGNSLGTSSTSSDGTTTYYDKSGRVIGREIKGSKR